MESSTTGLRERTDSMKHAVMFAVIAVAARRMVSFLPIAGGWHRRMARWAGYFSRYSFRNCSWTACGNVSMV